MFLGIFYVVNSRYYVLFFVFLSLFIRFILFLLIAELCFSRDD